LSNHNSPLALTALVAALVAGVGTVGCGDGGGAAGDFEPARPDTLTVMTEPLPTEGFWDGSGTSPTGGLEYGIANALAKRFGLAQVEIETAGFPEIVAGDLDDADLALALITPTDERDEMLDFSSPYIQAAPALVVREGTEVPDVETAQELVWALGRDTTFEDIVSEAIQPDAEPLLFDERADELDAVRQGEADVAMFDLPAAEAIARADPELAVAARLSDTEPIAAALPEGSENTEAVSSAIRAMIADGTLDELAEESLGVSLTESALEVPLLRTAEP
jgi:ABC-type amino acid transport substrate-binding protein